MEKYVQTLPAVNLNQLKAAARFHKLMTKDDLERELSVQALTEKQQQLEALKERYEHAGQLATTSETENTRIDSHKAWILVDNTSGRSYDTVLCPSVVCLSPVTYVF